MNKKSRLVILCLCITGFLRAADDVTLESLLLEMVNRDAAPQQPDPWFTCDQASSYNRASTSPDQPGWFANGDSGFYVRQEDREGRCELVLMDVNGPGAIVRFWATFSKPRDRDFPNGTLRFYLDDYEVPAFAGPILDILSSGKLAGPVLSFHAPDYSDTLRCGHNLYLPIPYGQRCKVTYETQGPFDGNGRALEAFYYQINYRTYSKQITVQTLSEDVLRQTADVRQAVEKQLASLAPPMVADDSVKSADGTLEPGSQKTVAFNRAGAIYILQCKLDAKDMAQALRRTVLEISFDGRRTVWAPIGDFFGTGAYPGAWRTWWSGMDDDGTLNCYWVMPFQRRAEITITNLDDKPVTIKSLNVHVKPYAWTDATMYFHAAWRSWNRYPAGARKAVDLNWLTVKGAGKYMGDAVSVFNGGWRWWGEGDEKIFVDGEIFPSHFGTGTEDYYGYAWGRSEPYANAFIAQPVGDGNKHLGYARHPQGRDYTVNNRFRLLDVIPFKSSLQFDMELLSISGGLINYAPTTWWYAAPAAESHVKSTSPQDVLEPLYLAEDDIMQPPARK